MLEAKSIMRRQRCENFPVTGSSSGHGLNTMPEAYRNDGLQVRDKDFVTWSERELAPLKHLQIEQLVYGFDLAVHGLFYNPHEPTIDPQKRVEHATQ
jgi:hypothetical protein